MVTLPLWAQSLVASIIFSMMFSYQLFSISLAYHVFIFPFFLAWICACRKCHHKLVPVENDTTTED